MANQAHILSFSEARKRGIGFSAPTSSRRPSVSRSTTRKPSVKAAAPRSNAKTSVRSSVATSPKKTIRAKTGVQAQKTARAQKSTREQTTRRTKKVVQSQKTGQAKTATQNKRIAQASTTETLRKKFRSAKADRAFNRTFGKNNVGQSQEKSSSRAAVYQMRMGRTHKKSSRMQTTGAASSKGKGLFAVLFGMLGNSRFVSRLVITACGVVFAVLLIYQPLAQYYGEARQLQRLEAEYSAIEAQNEDLRSEISYLSTDAGLEEYARYELGLVRPGEHVVEVQGLDLDVEPEQESNSVTYSIPEGSITAPDTWYSGILDVIFGYKD